MISPDTLRRVSYLERQQLAPREPGVYFVWYKRKLIYIGGSVCLWARLTYSHQHLKHIDRRYRKYLSVAWLVTPWGEQYTREAEYIRQFLPTLNRVHIPKEELQRRDHIAMRNRNKKPGPNGGKK